MNRCPNSISRCFLKKTPYPGNASEIWAIAQADVDKVLAEEKIPEILIEEFADFSRPRIAVMLNREKHPDRELKDYSIPATAAEAVWLSGGMPFFLSFEKIEEQLENINPDGIFLTGGDFALPKEWLEEAPAHAEEAIRRDAYVAALDYAKQKRLPLLGICAGMQMLAGFCGAKIKRVEGHRGYLDFAHEMRIMPQTLLKEIAGFETVKVNSNHSEAVSLENIGRCKVTAVAGDGTVEAVEPENAWNSFVLGIQSHPERFVKQGDKFSVSLFKSFIKACKK